MAEADRAVLVHADHPGIAHGLGRRLPAQCDCRPFRHPRTAVPEPHGTGDTAYSERYRLGASVRAGAHSWHFRMARWPRQERFER